MYVFFFLLFSLKKEGRRFSLKRRHEEVEGWRERYEKESKVRCLFYSITFVDSSDENDDDEANIGREAMSVI